jgi:hypothetical protein
MRNRLPCVVVVPMVMEVAMTIIVKMGKVCVRENKEPIAYTEDVYFEAPEDVYGYLKHMAIVMRTIVTIVSIREEED